MAHANNVGLNEISELGLLPFLSLSEIGVPLLLSTNRLSVPLLSTSILTQNTDTSSMDSKQSRIPKFGFSIRKPNGDKKPSPGTSPVSRSKSMKVQRTTKPIIHKTKQNNSIDNDDEEYDGPQTTTTTFLQPPRKDPSKSQPGSRSTTPITDNSVGPFTRSMTVSSSSRTKEIINRPQEMNGVKTHLRSSSFSASQKHSISASSIKRPVIQSQTPDRKLQLKSAIPKSPTESSRQLRRTSSNSKTSTFEESDGNITTSLMYSKQQSPGILRKPDSRKSSVGSQNGCRRPNSMISFTENASDLNELASEITQMGDSGVFGSAPPRVPSSRAHVTPNRQVQTKIYGSENSKLSKLRPPISKNISDDANRPSSAVANHNRNESRNVSRPRSAADMHKITTNISQNPSTTTVVRTTSRSSTPPSGRTTPQFNIQKSITEEEGTVNNKGVVPLTTPRRQIGPTRVGRTPFFRSTKITRISNRTDNDLEDAVGLNELEGAVLLDAEDYRRMLQEVKTLKSVLLRLKRELAADGSVTVPSTMSAKPGVKTEQPDRSSELCKEIEKLTMERDKAKSELENSQKKHKIIETKVDKLQEDLKGTKKNNKDLNDKLQFLESHRESLLDKVERLHADKHKLEDRLNSLEKSVMYESTILNDDWMEGELYDDSIDNGIKYDDEDITY